MRTAADFLPIIDAVPHYTPEWEQAWLTGQNYAQHMIQQNPLELAEFFEWVEQQNIQSYLEVGIWTGGLLGLVDELFAPPLIAAADMGWAQEQLGLKINLPERCKFFRGNGHSPEYWEWRRALGQVDLVFIDADHQYESVKRDFEINREFPHRFLAFHDIAHEHPVCNGAKQFWEELEGSKIQFVQEVPGCQYKMGIGVWFPPTRELITVPKGIEPVSLDVPDGVEPVNLVKFDVPVNPDPESLTVSTSEHAGNNFSLPLTEQERVVQQQILSFGTAPLHVPLGVDDPDITRDTIAQSAQDLPAVTTQGAPSIEVVVQSVRDRECWARCKEAIEASDIGTHYRQIFHPPGLTLAEFVVDMLDEMAQSKAEYVLRLEDDVTAVNRHIVQNIQTWPALRDPRFCIGWMFDPGGRCSERSIIDQIYKQPGKDKWHDGSLARAFAVLFRTVDLPAIRDYLHKWLRTEGNRPDYFDLAFGLAAQEIGKGTCVHSPSLVDHDQTIASLLDHYEDDFSTAGDTYRQDWIRVL